MMKGLLIRGSDRTHYQTEVIMDSSGSVNIFVANEGNRVRLIIGYTDITDTDTDTWYRYRYRYDLFYIGIGIGIGLKFQLLIGIGICLI